MTRNRISFLIGFFTGLLAAAFIFAGVDYVKAGHGLYPWPACCSDRDCFPVPPGFLKWVPSGNKHGDSGYIVRDTGQFFPDLDANGNPNWRIKQSLDYQNHICRLHNTDPYSAPIRPGRTLCIIVAPSGG